MKSIIEDCLVIISLSLALMGLSHLTTEAIDTEFKNQDEMIRKYKQGLKSTYISPSDELIINWNDKPQSNQK